MTTKPPNTIYATIKIGTITLVPRPEWFNDQGNPLSDAELLPHGYYPVVYAQPEYDPNEQTLTQNPIADWVVGETEVTATYTVTDIPTETLRIHLLDRITAKRWQVETGGLTLPGGIKVKTGLDDQNRITSVITNASRAGVSTVDFKADSGWVTLSLAEIEGVATAIALHVQACFSVERAHCEAVESITDTPEQTAREQLVAYDINTGWPT